MLKLSRKRKNRIRLLRNLATSVILYENVITTSAKAKSVKPYLIKLIKLSQKKDLTNLRLAKKILFNQKSYQKLFEDISPRLLSQNPSSSLRVVKIKNRLGDNSPMTKVSLRLKSLEATISEEKKQTKTKTVRHEAKKPQPK